MNPLKKLSNKMRACIEFEIQNPSWTMGQLADTVGVTKQSVWNWMHDPLYTAEREKRLKEEWKAAAKIAQRKMIELLNSESQGIALQAAKYVLDSTGYKPTDYVSIDADVFNYEVDYGDEG